MANYVHLGKALVLLLASYLVFLAFDVIASEDECIIFYSFEDKSDIPDKNKSFSNFGGWRFDGMNKSFESGNQSKENSSFWITRDGPLDVSFEWKISSEKSGVGVFQFQVDGIPINQSHKSSWTKVSETVPKGTHELKWIVYNGTHPFKGWIDNLCIRTHSCTEPCQQKIGSNQTSINQKPSILSLYLNKEGPQEVGTVLTWTAMASDPENDQLFYKFLLNSQTVQDWSANRSWNWKTEDRNLGSNTIEVRIRDGKHAGIDSFDDKDSSDFILPAPNKKPTIIDFGTENESPVDLDTPITFKAEAHDPENDRILYRFFVNESAIDNWSPENVWTWTANQTGVIRIEVWIRDEKHAGPESADDKQLAKFSIGVPTNQVPSILSLVSNKESPQEAGTVLTWTIMASDPEKDQLFYKFLLNNQTAQDWSSDNTWNWDTTHADAGDYKIVVWLIDKNHSGLLGADDKEEAEFTLIEQNEPPALTKLASDKLSPQEAGATVTWTVGALDPDNDLIYYKFLLNGANKTGWITNNSWNWKTENNDVGLNQLAVWVRDNKHAGINGMDDQILVDFEIKKDCNNIDNITISSPEEVCSGSVNNASVPYDENYSYSWNITNGDINSGRNEHVVTWVAGSSSDVTLEVTISNKYCLRFSPIRIQRGLRINVMDAPNNIIDIIPTDDLNLTERISKCDCKTIRLGKGNYTGPIIIKNSNIKLTAIYKHEATINGGKNSRGITLNNVSNVQLDKLNIYSNNTGVGLYKSIFCKLTNNKINIAGNKGIWMDESHNNSLEDNSVTIFPNGDDQTTECISLKNSHNNTIDSNSNISQLDYIYYIDDSYDNKILYENIGNIYCNGLYCKSCEVNMECDEGEMLNNRGNKWIKL